MNKKQIVAYNLLGTFLQMRGNKIQLINDGTVVMSW